jgi:AbiV family abortive infection protein
MDNKTFLNISKDECLVVYKEILENSDKRWNSAKLLSENGDYGLGISTSIISIEELIKSIIVLLDGKGFELRKINGMSSFFRNHEIRYVVAYSMFVMSLFGEDLIKILKKIKENPEWIVEVTKDMKSEKDFIEKKLGIYILRRMVTIKNELNWFANVDLFRQEGFYCDYDKLLKTPIRISKNDFDEVIFRLSKVRKIGKGFIQTLETNEEYYVNYFSKLIKDFKEKNHAQKIAKGLEFLKKVKKKPFELIKEKLNNF